MNDLNSIINKINKLAPKVIPAIEKLVEKLPIIQDQIDDKYDEMLDKLAPKVKPYTEDYEVFTEIPKKPKTKDQVYKYMNVLQDIEAGKWEDGYVSGAVYHGEDEHVNFLNDVYALHSQTNPLHSDLWPSLSKYEAEIVSMTAKMLGGKSSSVPDACGTVTSGGSESIMLAMKTYRDWALETKGIKKPELVVPASAHAAFDKSCQYFGIKKVVIPINENGEISIKDVKRAINRRTIALVGSAPGFPHGLIDPIEQMSELALKHKIGLHVDACLGGFVLPWAKKLGAAVPEFDFSLKGVTSISADTHKFGYASKGTSVILYRNKELIHHQYFTITDWPGGLYFSPTFAGSRPGALSASCWAAMLSIGEEGYLKNTKKILDTAEVIKEGIKKISDIEIIGDPLWVVAFRSKTLNIYQVLEFMTEKGWSLNGLHKPSSVHICVTLPHTKEGVAQRFVADLEKAVIHVKANPSEEGEMAPIYGLAANIPAKRTIGKLLKKYLDLYYRT